MIKITPFKSLVVNTVCGYLMIQECLVMVVHESLVCPEQLNWAVLQKNQILQFSSIFCIFEPFPAETVWFWAPSFHTEDNWGTQTQLLKKVQTLTDASEGNTMH